jgi:hypothetical protein
MDSSRQRAYMPRMAWSFPAADGSFTELCRMLDTLPLHERRMKYSVNSRQRPSPSKRMTKQFS